MEIIPSEILLLILSDDLPEYYLVCKKWYSILVTQPTKNYKGDLLQNSAHCNIISGRLFHKKCFFIKNNGDYFVYVNFSTGVKMFLVYIYNNCVSKSIHLYKMQSNSITELKEIIRFIHPWKRYSPNINLTKYDKKILKQIITEIWSHYLLNEYVNEIRNLQFIFG